MYKRAPRAKMRWVYRLGTVLPKIRNVYSYTWQARKDSEHIERLLFQQQLYRAGIHCNICTYTPCPYISKVRANFSANNAPLYQKLFTPTARTSMRAYIRYKNPRLLCAFVCPKIIFLSATCPYIRYIFKRRHYAPISKTILSCGVGVSTLQNLCAIVYVRNVFAPIVCIYMHCKTLLLHAAPVYQRN